MFDQPKPKRTIGPAAFAVGYVAFSPMGWAVGTAVVFVTAFVVAMAVGLPIVDAVKLSLVPTVSVAVVNGVFRYHHRASLDRAWQRLRSGEFRRDR
jgi:hypothetical protein